MSSDYSSLGNLMSGDVISGRIEDRSRFGIEPGKTTRTSALGHGGSMLRNRDDSGVGSNLGVARARRQ